MTGFEPCISVPQNVCGSTSPIRSKRKKAYLITISSQCTWWAPQSRTVVRTFEPSVNNFLPIKLTTGWRPIPTLPSAEISWHCFKWALGPWHFHSLRAHMRRKLCLSIIYWRCFKATFFLTKYHFINKWIIWCLCL